MYISSIYHLGKRYTIVSAEKMNAEAGAQNLSHKSELEITRYNSTLQKMFASGV